MSYRRMEQSKNRWKQKARSKGKEIGELKKKVKRLAEQLSQAKRELQKNKKPTRGAQAAPKIPAQEEKKSLKDTGLS